MSTTRGVAAQTTSPFPPSSSPSMFQAYQKPTGMPRARSLRSYTLAHNAAVSSSANDPNTPASRPLSPTFSETSQTTNISQMNFGSSGPEKIITRGDLKTSLTAYENLLSASAAYRDALVHMSKATASFADAMENCAGVKGASYLSGSRLLAASGLHHLMGNHWHILSASIEKNVEDQLRQHLDAYRTTVAERSASYEKALREKSRIIRETEMENMNLGRKKNRNLQSFREALAILQRQVEDLDELRASHYQEILEHEEEIWDFVQGKISLVVRSTLDVFDHFTAKASDPVIEPMLQSIPDPFDLYGPPKPEDQIFSILAPLPIFSSQPSPSPSPQSATAEIDATPIFASSPSGLSWTGAMGSEQGDQSTSFGGTEWTHVRTPTSSPPPSIKSSSTARAMSPSSSSRRANSYPSTSSPSSSNSKTGTQLQPRKAEAKLRKVLSVIDERDPALAQASGSHMQEASADTVTALTYTPDTNGKPHMGDSDSPHWGSPESAALKDLADDSSSQHEPSDSGPAASNESVSTLKSDEKI